MSPVIARRRVRRGGRDNPTNKVDSRACEALLSSWISDRGKGFLFVLWDLLRKDVRFSVTNFGEILDLGCYHLTLLRSA